MVGVERDVDSRCVASKMFVDGVVDDFPNTVVEG
jgi:hypothetical protein